MTPLFNRGCSREHFSVRTEDVEDGGEATVESSQGSPSDDGQDKSVGKMDDTTKERLVFTLSSSLKPALPIPPPPLR